jgi:hypothetical protein
MFDAANSGELEVCRFLWDHGAASTIRTKDSEGGTPMSAACRYGYLHVAKWLFEMGASVDIRTKGADGMSLLHIACLEGHLDVAQWLFKVEPAEIQTKDDDGWTPMYAACLNGHLHVAQWLFGVGAVEDIRTKDNSGLTPMSAAISEEPHHTIVMWLIRHGAANGESGHVSPRVLHTELGQDYAWTELRGLFESAQPDYFSSFRRLVLPVIRFGDAAERSHLQEGRESQTKIPRVDLPPTGPSPLALLRGHEKTILPIIADFLGVIRGRQLRNITEAAGLVEMAELMSEGGL